MSITTMVYLGAVLLLACIAFSLYFKLNKALHRLSLLCSFMAYLDDVKHTLPRDVAFNYDACHREAMKLVKKEGRA